MAEGAGLEVRPITAEDVDQVARFLAAELNGRLSAETWAAAVVPPWPVDAPNHGFLLADSGRVVGVQLAIYSERMILGRAERFCNLAAWCVLDDYRLHGVRLLRSALAQPGYTFTDLSPSGSVIEVNQRLKFTEFDTTSVLLPNLPRRTDRTIAITADPVALAEALSQADLRLHLDHRGCLAARQVMISHGDDTCLVVYRRDRRKRISAFASILYASRPELLRRALPALRAYLLRKDRLIATLAEVRLVGRPAGAVDLPGTRRKMFRSDDLTADQVDYLYSELTCVPW
ncbi:hypothetical protein [Microlunatus sp. GCM10028923]|uniref:hypothetical protein n=1 Tax=Microlunatus sp. GCM10028923 TaxID=3273400 RepID=UPI00361B94BA